MTDMEKQIILKEFNKQCVHVVLACYFIIKQKFLALFSGQFFQCKSGLFKCPVEKGGI